MLLKVYAIKDSAIGAFQQPFFMQTKGQAVRTLQDSLLSSDSNLAKHPNDYTLFELAEYDDVKGKFIAHDTPISIGLVVEFMPPKD